jgi:hypothetical protein
MMNQKDNEKQEQAINPKDPNVPTRPLQNDPAGMVDQNRRKSVQNISEDDIRDYDATGEEIIAAHDFPSNAEGVDEEWSGDDAENRNDQDRRDDSLI